MSHPHPGLAEPPTLANRGLRKQAIDLARNISNTAVRDRALSELAQ